MGAAPGEGGIHCSALPALCTDSTVVPVPRVGKGKECSLAGSWLADTDRSEGYS